MSEANGNEGNRSDASAAAAMMEFSVVSGSWARAMEKAVGLDQRSDGERRLCGLKGVRCGDTPSMSSTVEPWAKEKDNPRRKTTRA